MAQSRSQPSLDRMGILQIRRFNTVGYIGQNGADQSGVVRERQQQA